MPGTSVTSPATSNERLCHTPHLVLTFLAQLHLLASGWIVIVAAAERKDCVDENWRGGWVQLCDLSCGACSRAHIGLRHCAAWQQEARHSMAQRSAAYLSNDEPMEPLTSSRTMTLRLGRWNEAAWMPAAAMKQGGRQHVWEDARQAAAFHLLRIIAL